MGQHSKWICWRESSRTENRTQFADLLDRFIKPCCHRLPYKSHGRVLQLVSLRWKL